MLGTSSRLLSVCRFVSISALLCACDDVKQSEAPESSSEACAQGDEGCECYPNDTCNGKLECFSDICVDTSRSGNDGGPGDDDADDDDDAADDDADDDVADDDADDDVADDDDAADDDVADDDVDPGGPVERYGQLRVVGTQLVDESGNEVQLKGVSSMWLNWEPTGYAENLNGLRWMRDNWQLKIIRAAMGVDEEGAYLENPEKALGQVRRIVNNAIQAGVYVLIDWHDHEAEAHRADAQAFFAEMAQEYGDVPNVLYEVYNEPLDVSWGGVLTSYHNAVVDTIRQYDPDNVIILGTPNWSQDVDIAAESPVSGSNLMYTLHFYACSHTASLRQKAQTAYNAGLPLFVTEWGATHADGGLDGIVCEAEAQAWHDWMDQRNISWTAWKLDGCTDSSCFFKDRTAPVSGGWGSSDLNGHAPFVIERMLADNDPPDGSGGAGGSDNMGGSGNTAGSDNVGGSGNTGGSEPTGCEPTGTCSMGDGMDCVGGDLVPRDCAGCALLSCGESCCSHLTYLGADTYPDFVVREDLITGFSQTASGATLDMSFEGSFQMGAIVFGLDQEYSIPPSSVLLDLVAYGDGLLGAVTVSLENGDAGCQYPVYTDGVTGLSYLDDLYPNCWESFTASSPVRQINVRVDAESSGNAQLTVYSISW